MRVSVLLCNADFLLHVSELCEPFGPCVEQKFFEATGCGGGVGSGNPLDALPRNNLRFGVEFTDDVWDNITYDMIKAVDVFKTWLAHPDRLEVREIIAKRATRANPRYADRAIKDLGGVVNPDVLIQWVLYANFQEPM